MSSIQNLFGKIVDHRGLHCAKKGRDREIEGYVSETVDWVIKRIQPCYKDFSKLKLLDVGTHYGYAMHCFMRNGFVSQNCFGIDLEPERCLKETKERVICLNWYDVNKFFPSEYFDVIFFNHGPEHATNVFELLTKLYKAQKKGGYIFLGCPNSSYDWANRPELGHVSIFNPVFLMRLAEFIGWKTAELDSKCFRGNNVEIWYLGWKQ